MNPSNESINLPSPVAEQVPGKIGAPEANTGRAEQAPAATERAPQSAQAAPPLVLPLASPASPQPLQNDVSITSSSVVTNVQDDGDLIEKEWVTKAKQIVEANREDPYKQSEELTVFRADYMQKRYNKSIKVSK